MENNIQINQESLLDILPCGYFATLSNGLIVKVNSFFLQLLGYSSEELVKKKKFHDLLSIAGRLYFETHISPLLQMQGKIKEINLEIAAKDGKKIPILINGAAISNEEGKNQFIQYTFFDIMQRKKFEIELMIANQRQNELIQELTSFNEKYIAISRALEQEKQFYKSIVDNQSFYIIKTDLQGRYSFVNNFFCYMLGKSREKLLGQFSLDSIIAEDRQACQEIVVKCFEEPNINHRVKLRKHTPRGIVYNLWDFNGVTDDSGDVIEILCIGYEITELMEKQKQLQNLTDVTAEQNKRLQNFTYIVSHNVRSHVANLKGLMAVVDVEADSREDMVEYLGFLKGGIDGLDETINNLNEIVSAQNSINLPQKTILLHTYLEKTITNISEIIAISKATIYNQIPQEASIDIFPAYLDSILLNMLTNAIKYKSPDRFPEIYVNFYEENNYKVLSFKDNGIGIDLEKNKDKLFGMYKTFHGNSDAKGLGLFITKTQIESMKGKIEVESEVGIGTNFKIYFPENQ